MASFRQYWYVLTVHLWSHSDSRLYLWRCLPEKYCAKQMVLKNIIRTYWGMQKSKMQNHIMCPLKGLVQHRPKYLPNLGRMGFLCQLLSPKGYMIWFLFFQYTFPVAKWVRKYPPCPLHKTFLVRCLRKYSEQCGIKQTNSWDAFRLIWCISHIFLYFQRVRNSLKTWKFLNF